MALLQFISQKISPCNKIPKNILPKSPSFSSSKMLGNLFLAVKMAKFSSPILSIKNLKWKKHKSFRANKISGLSILRWISKLELHSLSMPMEMLESMICGETIKSQDSCPVMGSPCLKEKEKDGWLSVGTIQHQLFTQTKVFF